MRREMIRRALRCRQTASWATSAVVFASCACAQQSMTTAAPLDVIQLRANLYVLSGGGANIVLQTGEDGAVLVDAGTQEQAPATLDAVRRLTEQPVRYILNTSAEGDHTGGNGELAKAGRSIFFSGPDAIITTGSVSGSRGATVLAPLAVLRRLSIPTGKQAPLPSDMWPTETFDGSRRYIYFNREGIEIFPGAARDDTDSIVFFRGSDVICAGEAIDTTRFPHIDLTEGGSIQGEIDTLNRILALAVRPLPFVFASGGTYIVPAHGRIYQQADVVEYRDMMVILRDIVQDMINRGMTLAQIESANPAQAYERQYGSDSGSWTTSDFVRAVYLSLKPDLRKKKRAN